MATLNLGRIKPVFQGAYNGSTAYVVDDIVTFGDETFICIQASTGNATSNASYWTNAICIPPADFLRSLPSHLFELPP